MGARASHAAQMKNSSMLLWLFAALLVGTGVAPGQDNSPATGFNALVFSKTLMFRHASITNGIAAIKQLGAENHFQVDATEDAGWFTATNLAKYKVVIFLSTSGDILNEEQQAVFKGFIEQGGGLVAIHAAVAGDVATEGNWPWYGQALCARFTNHSAIVRATVHIEDRKHPSTERLPEHWVRTDEWYNFIVSPRDQARILASLDEETYQGGTMGKDHPIAWCKQVGQGRIWYTALGHTEASFTEPLFLKHLLGGIQAAAGTKPADFRPEKKRAD
jgi:type 1 glutamine amidotransferase